MNKMTKFAVYSTVFIALIAILVVFFTGCSTSVGSETLDDRFTVTNAYGRETTVDGISIVTDAETGVQYLVVDGYNGIGLTKLE